MAVERRHEDLERGATRRRRRPPGRFLFDRNTGRADPPKHRHARIRVMPESDVAAASYRRREFDGDTPALVKRSPDTGTLDKVAG